jgi:hypothetical protein
MSALLAAALILASPAASETDRAALTEGVASLRAPGAVPGPVMASGEGSFILLTARTGRDAVPLGAAAQAGKGRIVVVGHEGFFGERALDHPDNARFLRNALSWLGGGDIGGLHLGQIGMPALAKAVAAARVHALDRASLVSRAGEFQVLCMTQAALDGDPAAVEAAVRFVHGGGGLLIAGPAWGWESLNPGKSLAADHSGNEILARFGLGFASGTVDGPFSPEGAEDPLLTTRGALDALASDGLSAERARVATGALQRALALRAQGVEERVRELAAASPARYPTKATPISGDMPMARLITVLEAPNVARLAPRAVPAHPSATSFPGPVDAAAPRIARRVAVDAGVSAWHPTDLYAAPGDLLEIRLPEGSPGMEVRIGAHSDRLWHLERWERYPEISLTAPLKAGENRLASPFGGLVYLVPARGSAGTVEVEIRGAVAAPAFHRGTTSSAAWRREVEASAAPWLELYGRWIALTLPAEVVRGIEDPEALMAYWDEVAELCYELYATPKRPRPERFVPDIQISAGYMHAGYPIMTHMDVAAAFADLAKLRAPLTAESRGPIWGFYHELGHNFQEPEWTFEGTGEVTNNLFSLYGAERLNGVTPATYGLAHRAIDPKVARERLEKHLAGGAPYQAWKADPFLALTMYVQLREAFGWEPFTRVFAEYREVPRAERPRTDLEKRDQWMMRMSRAVARNLGPFFEAWGVPTSEGARAEIRDLPSWMPSNWPSQGSSWADVARPAGPRP